MIQARPLEVAYQTGFNLYAIVRGVVGGTRQVWNPSLNTGAGGWEVYNSAHWSQYAIALTEDVSSGYYAAAYPVNIAGAVITSETFYIRAGGSPTLGDVPAANLAHTQGDNMTGVMGDTTASANLQQALISEQTGVAVGVPTTTIVSTNLTNSQQNAYQGRVCIFTSGPAFQCVARIATYGVTNGVLTFVAPLAIAPNVGDSFIIV